MRFSTIGYLLKEGLLNVLKNKKLSIASLSVTCATLFIFGIFLIGTENINAMVKTVEAEQGMQIFFDRKISNEEALENKTILENINGVASVQFISKEEALESQKDKYGSDKAYLFDSLDANLYPPSFLVTLSDLSLNESVQSEIMSKVSDINKIGGANDTIDTIMKIGKAIRNVTGVILIILIVISIFIISNTIKMAVHARRREISIMKYVGATDGFIRWPFIIEGIIIGLIGALVTIFLITMGYDWFLNNTVSSFNLGNIFTFVPMETMKLKILIVYIGIGMGIGIIGSVISLRKYLKV